MRIACIQMAINDHDKADNLSRAERLLSRASGADLVLLPELWNIGYFSFDKYEVESETLEAQTVQLISNMARKLGAYILGGSLIIRDSRRFYNTSLLFDRSGEIIATYRKIHLFGYGSRESQLLSRGEAVVTVKTEIGTFGLSICYDLRFPELYRKMVHNGAELFLVVAAWPYPRLEHWIMFNRIRAVENCSFLASANCVGVNRGKQFCGHSMIVDPWGVILASAGDEECIIWADVDIDKVHRVRSEFPALRDIVL